MAKYQPVFSPPPMTNKNCFETPDMYCNRRLVWPLIGECRARTNRKNWSCPVRLRCHCACSCCSNTPQQNGAFRSGSLLIVLLSKCEPDEKYTYQGANLLVDGLQGDDNYRSGRYIGLYGQNFDAIIDLQETKEISSVSLGTYLVPGDYIFGLTGLEIYGSNDGSAYSKIASKTIPVLEKGSKNNVLKRDTVSFGKTKARYVRIIGKNTPVLPKWHPGAGKRTYLFLDEITID